MKGASQSDSRGAWVTSVLGSCRVAGTPDVSAFWMNDPKPPQSPMGPSFHLVHSPWPTWLARQSNFRVLSPPVGSARASEMDSSDHLIPRASSISVNYEPRSLTRSVEIIMGDTLANSSLQFKKGLNPIIIVFLWGIRC